jgi:hypothetical protein
MGGKVQATENEIEFKFLEDNKYYEILAPTHSDRNGGITFLGELFENMK